MTVTCRKIRYPNENAAKDALLSCKIKGSLLRRDGKSREGRRESRVYRCLRCGGWHLTSRRWKRR